MQGDWVTQAALPAGLMFIMFTLGIGLTPADFRRVFAQPRALAIGILCHFVLLPLVAFLVVKAFGLSGALAVGFMIVAACPTGTTSNLLTYFARGDVALALSFTAFAGLVSIVTVPFIVAAAIGHFLGAERAVDFPAGAIMGQIFAVMALPVAAGMAVRARFPGFAARWQGRMGALAAIVFVAIVAASIARHFAMLQRYLPVLAPSIFAINFTMLALGYALARAAKVPRDQAITVAIESSVQNVALALVIGSTLLRDDAMTLPAAIYGVLMYVTGVAFVFVGRRLMRREQLREQLGSDPS
jgi:BASS family bile acid:Na+ symporter